MIKKAFSRLGMLYIIPFFMSIYVASCATVAFIQPQQNVNVATNANEIIPQNNSPSTNIVFNKKAVLGNVVAERETILIPNTYSCSFLTTGDGGYIVAKSTIIGSATAYGDGLPTC